MQILYFSRVKEIIGKDSEELSPPEDVNTIEKLMNWLAEQDHCYSSAFENRDGLRAAVNQNFAQLDHKIKMGDEIAIFPPVTGG